jgi:hypothetical protein
MTVLLDAQRVFRMVCAVGVLLAASAGFDAAASDVPNRDTVQLARSGKPLSPPEVEKQLKALGFDPGPIDGVFDAQTEQALRAFQRKAGIGETGTLDDATMAELVASTESKMLHSLPDDLLPANTSLENFGTRVILRPAKDRTGVMVLVIPSRGGYKHQLQYLGLMKDGRAHIESTVWTDGAIHEIEGPLTLAGYVFAPDPGRVLRFRVERDKGYVFIGGHGAVTPPDGGPRVLGPDQKGTVFGHPPRPATKGKAK